MQITTDTVAAAWIGWKEYSSKNKNALGEDLMRAALEAALGAKSSRSLPTLRCIVTGHIVGTDTRMIGKPCECPTCIAAACIEDLAAALKPFADWAPELNGMPDNGSLIATYELNTSVYPDIEDVRHVHAMLEKWGLK